jgi:membrane protein
MRRLQQLPIVAGWARTLVVESSLVLGAQGFLALFPLVIVVYAVAPPRLAQSMIDTMRDRFGMSGGSVQAVELIADRDALRSSLSVVGFILVIGSATAFTRALQRVYERAWDLPKLGLRGVWRWVAWLVGLLIYLTMLAAAVQVTHDLHLSGAFGALFGLALWWWTPYLLLGGRVRWRALAVGALLTSLSQLVVSLVSATLIPRMIRSNETSYGPIGVVFTIESWLIVVCGVLVGCAAVSASLAREPGAVGAWVRGTPNPEGWRARLDPPAPLRRSTVEVV